ncbi:hypothetical protein DL769_005810 [Monosporascus sp. CRB-8-3]|nr:hypothetical protein DL769_005810 [Monosporascus sp. CRB-8-3]
MGDFANFKIFNGHGLNELLLDLSKEVMFIGWRRKMYSHRDDVEAWTDNAVFVRDPKSSAMYDLAKNNIVQALVASILFLG